MSTSTTVAATITWCASRCGSSVEFFLPKWDRLEQEIGRKHQYLATRHTFQIYGLCESCRKKPTTGRNRPAAVLSQ